MIKEKLKSVRVKLFLVLCVVTILLVICLIAINSLVLENFYIYNKTNTIKEVYNKINKYYKDPDLAINFISNLYPMPLIVSMYLPFFPSLCLIFFMWLSIVLESP